MTIELHQTAPFQETEAVMPGRRHNDPDPYAPLPRLVFPAPKLDPALVDHKGVCPICGELLGGPECGCDWDAITAEGMAGTPEIYFDMRSTS